MVYRQNLKKKNAMLINSMALNFGGRREQYIAFTSLILNDYFNCNFIDTPKCTP